MVSIGTCPHKCGSSTLTSGAPIWSEISSILAWGRKVPSPRSVPREGCTTVFHHLIQSLHAGTISLTPPRARHRTLRKLLRRKFVMFMSACSGRNYDFRCIAAKRRTNLKATKRLDRLAPNLAHMCRFIWEWIYAKQIAIRDTRWYLGFRGLSIQQSGEAVKRLDRLAPTLVHVCGFIWEWT